MNVPATANAALMAAGCENLLPMSKDLSEGRLWQWFQQRFPNIPVRLDLSGRFDGTQPIKMDKGQSLPSTGSAKNDVYRFAIQRYMKSGACNPYYLWYNCDAAMLGKLRAPYGGPAYTYLGDRNEFQQNGMFNADYWVAKRAFIFDVSPWGDCTPNDDPNQPLGTDLNTYNDILEASYKKRGGEFGLLGGFVPWWIKYTDVVGQKHQTVQSEWEYTMLATSYNLVNDADAAFGIANASFFMHLPQLTRDELKNPSTPKIVYKNDTTYIAFCMLDYDASSWVNQMVEPIYNDPERGKLPLNWCVNPILHQRVPNALRYLYEHRTKNDYFGFSFEGVGYLHPRMLTERCGRIKESGLAKYEGFVRTFYGRYNIDYTAFYITNGFIGPWIEMASRVDKGFGCNQNIQQQLINHVPAGNLKTFHVAQKRELEEELTKVFANSAAAKRYTPSFKAYRCILVKPSTITGIIEKLRKQYPEARVEIVDLRNYYRLLKHKLSTAPASPYRNSPEISAAPEASAGASTVQSIGGYYTIETVQGKQAWAARKQDVGLYLCFDLDDAFAQHVAGQPVDVQIEYLDGGDGELILQYDSTDPSAIREGAYKDAGPRIQLKNTGEWRTATFRIADTKFAGRQNDSTDLRIFKTQNDELIIRSIALRPIK